ncbi:MAG: ribonuclease II [Treponema sp.]|nr:MAG: ribonuclease II [Treponema sp.]
MQKGFVVLYKNKPAVIKESVADKIIIELQDGEKKVRNKDVEILSKFPVTNLKALLNATISEPDFSDVFEFFENEEPTFDEIVELVWGKYLPEQIWKIWQTVSDSVYFETSIPTAPIKIRNQSEIDELKSKQEEKANHEEKYIKFIDVLKKQLKKTEDDFNSTLLLKEFPSFLQEIESFALGKMEKSKVLSDAKVKQTPENAHDVLIKLGYWNIEKNPYPARYGCSVNDSKEKIIPPDFNKPFLDLTSLTAYAIDNRGSTDPDDAVCYDGKYLWIHVANPAETVTCDSTSDLSARKRGVTLYIPDGTARMLGSDAVKYYALGLTEQCYALSFRLELNDNFEIENTEIMRTKITVKRMTYDEAEAKKDSKELKPLFDIANSLFERRIKNGAVSIQMPEVYIRVMDKTVCITPSAILSSQAMIREMMLIAGEAGATFAFKNRIPFQYVSQEQPTLPNDLPEGLAGEYKKRKSMKSRTVSTTPSKHAALGISMYAQVTSPLRRYGDLVSHQQLLKFIDGESLIPKDDFLHRIALGDQATRQAILATRSSKLHWTLVYMQQNPNITYEAIVLENTVNYTHIIIPELAFEYNIKLKSKKMLNEKLNVRTESVNIPFQNVVLKEV